MSTARPPDEDASKGQEMASKRPSTSRYQHASPLLCLPPELRNKIYTYVLGDRTIMCRFRNHADSVSAVSKRQKEYAIYQRPAEPRWSIPLYTGLSKNFLSITLVCQQLYLETRYAPFQANTVFHSGSGLYYTENPPDPGWCSILNASQLIHITTLSFMFKDMINMGLKISKSTLGPNDIPWSRSPSNPCNFTQLRTVKLGIPRQIDEGRFSREEVVRFFVAITGVEYWTSRTDLNITYDGVSTMTFKGAKEERYIEYSRNEVSKRIKWSDISNVYQDIRSGVSDDWDKITDASLIEAFGY